MYFNKNLIYFFCEEKINDELNFVHSGWECYDSGYKFGPTIREFYLIHVIVSGKGYYNAGGVTYWLEKNNAFLVHPGEITSYYADKDDPWEYCFFAFSGSKALEYINATGFCNDNLIITINNMSF